jgi:hypothetical protein
MHLEDKPRMTTTPKPFIFVLMPFDKEFDDVYQLGIKPACDEAGAYAERLDDQIFHESMLDRIYHQISKADVIVADMTGRNTNVFYETGYAHALGKPVGLLTQRADDIPFDLKHYPHIVYEKSIVKLIPELKKRVAFAIQKPKEAVRKSNIEVYVGGKALAEDPPIVVETDQEELTEFRLKYDFHNSTSGRAVRAIFRVGLLCSIQNIAYPSAAREINRFNWTEYLQPDGSSRLYLYSRPFDILPGSWLTMGTSFFFSRIEPDIESTTLDFTLRVLTEKGPVDFPFRVAFVRRETTPRPRLYGRN